MKKRFFIISILCLCVFYCVLHFTARTPQLTGVAALQEIDTQHRLTISMDKTHLYNPFLGNGTVPFSRVYTVRNHTAEVLYFSKSKWVERYVDGVWYKLSDPLPSEPSPRLDEPFWLKVKPGAGIEYAGDYLSAWRAQFAPGRYRMVFPVRDTSDILFYAAAEFTIR